VGEAASESGARIFGREAELALLRDFVAADRSPKVFLLTGAPGMGKTTLWEAGIDAARERQLHVLSARPAEPSSRCPPAGR
jgi:putative protein kinase ArgK-like GTPase of G3E family